jgi:hypothetical protein
MRKLDAQSAPRPNGKQSHLWTFNMCLSDTFSRIMLPQGGIIDSPHLVSDRLALHGNRHVRLSPFITVLAIMSLHLTIADGISSHIFSANWPPPSSRQKHLHPPKSRVPSPRKSIQTSCIASQGIPFHSQGFNLL